MDRVDNGAKGSKSRKAGIGGWVIRLFERIARWRVLRLAAKELSALDDRSLKDIGITRGEIDFVVRQAERGEWRRGKRAVAAVAPAVEPVKPAEPVREIQDRRVCAPLTMPATDAVVVSGCSSGSPLEMANQRQAAVV